MKFRPKWYPIPSPERAEWHDNQVAQLNETGADYDFLPADIAKATLDRDIVRYFAEKQAYFEAEMAEFRAARDEYLDGNIGSVDPKMPTFDVGTFPAGALVGVSARVEKFSKKLVGANNYTESAGAAYRIVGSTPAPQPDGDKKPEAKSVKTLPNFGVSFKIAMQKAGGIQSEMTRDGDTETHKRFYTDGDIVDDTPPLNAGKAETRNYRFYFIEKNHIIGQSSDIYEVTVHP